jgi:hypothetical protein
MDISDDETIDTIIDEYMSLTDLFSSLFRSAAVSLSVRSLIVLLITVLVASALLQIFVRDAFSDTQTMNFYSTK